MGRLVFMGSPEFALPCLQELLKDGHDIPLVLSQPDRPAGRGKKLRATAVSAWAREQGMALKTPEKLRDAGLRAELAAFEPDLFVVVAYRILPPKMIAIPRLGAVNLHASLLPHYRGAAPIQRVLMDGVDRTGLSTFLIERGVDTGQLLLQEELPLGADETCGELHDRMLETGPKLLARSVRQLLAGEVKPIPQPEGAFALAPKLTAEDRRLDPADSSQDLHNRIRALSPMPAARIAFRGRELRLLRSASYTGSAGGGDLGTLHVDEGRLLMCCGDGHLEILELAPAGKRGMTAREWLNGANLKDGERLLPLNQG